MKVREHRGGLAESLATIFNIDNRNELLEEINERLGSEFEHQDIMLVDQGYDERIGWHTQMISIRGYGVFGYCDGIPS